MKNELETLQTAVRAFILQTGENKTNSNYVSIYLFNKKRIQMPETTNPYLYLVLDGELRLYTPSGILDYMAGQYSISAIDTPTAGDVIAFSKQGDFIAIAMEFTLNDVLSVMTCLEQEITEKILDEKIPQEEQDKSDRAILHCMRSLVDILDDKFQLSFMSSHIKREMIFHMLCGSSGRQFLQSIIGIKQSGDIYELNNWIKENYRESFTVEELADKWSMSTSILHQRFKSAVGMGLLQCQKRLRLTEARRLMLDENRNVTEAAMDVGYESSSQFAREYKKMFGHSPKDDILFLKKQLEK